MSSATKTANAKPAQTETRIAPQGGSGTAPPKQAQTPPDDPNILITPDGTRISLLPADVDRDTRALEQKAEGFRKAMEATDSMLRRTMLKGSAIKAIREGITEPMAKIIMSLMNNPLGFMTDRNPKAKRRDNKVIEPYDRDTALDAVAHGLLCGVFPFNNEMNIISGGMMIVLNGWRRLVSEIPNLDYPSIDFGDPVATPMHFCVPCTATWVHKSKLQTLKRNVFVKRDQWTTTDQVIGKAERKVLKAVYMMICGPTFAEVDDDDAADVSEGEIENLKAQGRLKLAKEALGNAWSPEAGLQLLKEIGATDWRTATTEQLNKAAANLEARIMALRPKQTEIPPAETPPEEGESEAPAEATGAKCNPATLTRLREVIAAEGWNDIGLQDACKKLGYAATYTVESLDSIAELGTEAVGKIADELAGKP